MVFSSHLFMFYFLPAALLIYYASPRRMKHLLLTLLSYVFYGWANPAFIILMFTSTVIDYLCGLGMTGHFRLATWKGQPPRLEKGGERTWRQKLPLIISICTNLSLLGVFKYFNFGIDSYNALVEALGADQAVWTNFFRITLPLGISFYTFQSMSYSIDVYRGDAKPIRNFTDFSCYVAMFPQLVAGPIIRFSEVDDQLQSRTHTVDKFARGVSFICLGFAKKILLANACGMIADKCFDAAGVGFLDSWVGVIAYSFQIYFDFSAYSDMAIGLGLILGFVFPKNFDSPYHAASITEFWRRWHISLSTWLRDYLYIPLGGNRKGPKRTYVNLALVMLLGGLWHGAAWTFVIWGGIHGGMLAFERLQGKDSFYSSLPRPVKVAITYIIVLFTWVFFRANTLEGALTYCGSMLGLNGAAGGSGLVAGTIYQPFYLVSLIAAGVVAWTFPQTWDFTRRITWPKVAGTFSLFWVSLVVLTTQAYNPFIYFIF
ncbi:MAG: MBOAT family O-acyltransferase [Phycisphaerae bacterium]